MSGLHWTCVGVFLGGYLAGAQLAGAEEDSAGRAAAKPWNRGVSVDTREKARQHFLEGNRLFNVPLFAQAAEKYKEALALWQHPAFYYNLGIAQLNLVQPIEAYASLDRALLYGPDGLGEREYRQAREYLERLEQQLGHVVVACDEAGAEVTMDGRYLFTGPGRYQGVVAPGRHQVVASKQGRIPETAYIELSPGQRAELTLVLRAPDRIETERHGPAWVPWASMAAGAALISMGSYLDWRSSQALDDFDADFNQRCPRGCTDTEVPDLTSRLDSTETAKSVALGLYVGGGLVLAGSAALLYVNRERVVRTQVRDGGLSLAPVLRPDSVGITARSRF